MAQLPTPKPVMPPIAPAAPTAPSGPALPMMTQPANQPTAGYMAAPDKTTVRFQGVNQNLLQLANEVGNSLYGTLKRPLYVTSARDSVHSGPTSPHYDGNALDLRTRDLNASQRQAIVAGFRARGVTAVDEGDHIHVSTRGSVPTDSGPGTVMASIQGRGPTSIGAGGASVRTASIDAGYQPASTTATDAGPISPVPMARSTESPASVTNPGGTQPETEPPSVAAAPSLAAPRTAEIQPGLGIPPLGTGTDVGATPPLVPQGPIKPPADPVAAQQQVAQAQIPLPPPRPPGLGTPQQAPVATPVLPQPAPAVAPPAAPPAGRQAQAAWTEQQIAQSGPFPNYNSQQLLGIAGRIKSTSAYAGYRDAMIKEVERRSKILGDQFMDPLKTQELSDKQRGDDYDRYLTQYQEMNRNKPDAKPPLDREQWERVKAATPQGEYHKLQAKTASEEFDAYRKLGDDASKQRTTIGILKQLNKTPEFYTGEYGPHVARWERVKSALGLPNTATQAETFEKLIDQLALESAGGKLGAGVSNTDLDFLRGLKGGLSTTKEGNALILDIADRLQARNERIADMAVENAERNGGVFNPTSFYKEVRAERAKPLFNEKEMENLQAVANRPAPNADAAKQERVKRHNDEVEETRKRIWGR